jgi:hypothetical protein
VRREKKKYPFFSFFLIRGWCREEGCITVAPDVTVAPIAPKARVDYLRILTDVPTSILTNFESRQYYGKYQRIG